MSTIISPEFMLAHHRADLAEAAQRFTVLRARRDANESTAAVPSSPAPHGPFGKLRELLAKHAARRRFTKSLQIQFW